MSRIKLILPFTLLMLIVISTITAKGLNIDSLKASLSKVADTARVKALIHIGALYANKNNYELALSNYLEALKLAETIQNKDYIFLSLFEAAHFYEFLEKHDDALGFALRAQKVAEELGNKEYLFKIYDLIGGFIYFNQQKFDQAILYGQKMLKISEESHNKERIAYMQMWFGDVYREQHKFDKSFEIYKKALQGARDIGDDDKIIDCLNGLGLSFENQSKYAEALPYYIEAFNEAVKDHMRVGFFSRHLSYTYYNLKNYDKALEYAKIAADAVGREQDPRERSSTYALFRKIYTAKGNYKEAYNYALKYAAVHDSINSSEVQEKMNLLQVGYESEKQNKAMKLVTVQNRQQKIVLIFVFAGLLAAGVFSFVLVVNNRQKQMANKLLQKQKEEIIQQKVKVEETLGQLKSTQAQLIQSEKMASLGELTAGIAHEIQNPLNFVNNFSEVSIELLEELKAESEKAKAERDEQLENELINDLIANAEKINHHGKRADSIVKGMLEHSRTRSGQKELTDINKLADEYLRLSYHGLRAKDKSFNAEMITHFDETLPKIEVVPQDIGRVLLNLFNNAFYTVNEKKKTADANYKPTLELSTFKPPSGDLGVIVHDNGNGIPDAIKDKVMQPFFTTKPTGEGTGLGLSLSYDIVVKGHGGTIKIDSIEGEGSEFIITFPIS